MKSLSWRFCLMTALVGLCLFGRATTGFAQDAGVSAERFERLERRVNEMAEHQEQFMRRLSEQMQRQAAMGQPGIENPRPPMPSPGGPAAGMQNPRVARADKSLHDALGLLFLIGIICNILLAIWIFTDIRKRGEGSGIFVAMALFAGIPAALIYALTRIGEKKT